MILQRCSSLRSCILKKYLLKDVAICRVAFRIQEYTGFSTLIHHSNVPKSRYNTLTCQNLRSSLLLPAKWYSNGFVDGDVTELQNENELKKISELFPEARVTLHIISQRSPDKIYDVHFKQYMPGKKAIRNHEWTCIYKFVWPEKMKFEGTAISKRVAAEKAAIRALHWLYKNGRIDRKGQVIYDKKVLEELKTNLNEPVHANISEKSVERIQKIWSDYENGIREIYERAAVKAKLKALEAPALITKDSTIDEQEGYPEEINVDEQLAGTPDLKGPVHPVYGRVITPPTQQTLKRRAEALDRVFEEYDGNITPLPIDQYSERIISSLQESRVSVIVGAAGCGKSTRVPAALLRHCRTGASVVVAEPRRVAALGLAERVAEEFGEQVGDSIGYQVRLKSKLPRPPAGSILYCTSGILLNRLHGNPGLVGCSHVIIDEAHERDVNTDVIMLLLKRAMKLNGDLKLLIMSATLDTKVFTEYFDSCPVVEVPGRTYPVDISYLEDVQKKFCLQLPDTLASSMREDGRPRLNITEVTEVIKAVDKREKEGAILAFLPGWAEIKYAKQLLDAHYAGSTLHLILPVHSRLSTTDQSKMFNPPTPGVRKIVLATNIAETSVTIPDIVHVVDSGVHKENRVRDYTGTASLETVWVSLAGAKQRCGRAGRVQPGHCYKLYTKEKESEFASHTTPEILRVPLEQTVLNCKTYAPELKAKDFLSQLPEPPSSKAIQYAVNELIDIGALTPSESLSPLGSLLSRLPCSPRAGLVLVRGVMASAALPAADVAAGSDADTDMFVDSHDRREEIRETKRKFNSTSDHLALHRIQHEFENRLHKTGSQTVDDWCDRHSLRKERLNYIKSVSSLYLRELIKTGIIDCNLELDDLNRFSDIDELSVATLFSGVGSLLITRKHVKTKGQLKTVNEVFTTTGERAHIASESVNYSLTKRTNKPTLLTYYGGHHSIERRALTVYKSSVISPQAVILFSTGPVDEIENDGEAEVLSLPRHKLKIYLPASQSEVLLKARQMLWATFNYHIDRDTKDLEYDDVTSANRFRVKLLNAICRMLVDANHDTAEGKSVDVFS